MKKLLSNLSLVIVFVVASTLNLKAQSKDIVATAASVDDFSTLVTAVKAADLVEVLQSKGPFTVFAPVNQAFKDLPDGTLKTLLNKENITTLQSVLTYHVVKGNVMAEDVLAGIEKGGGKLSVKTVSGKEFTVMLKGENVVIMDQNGNSAKILKTDIKASNGVIHVIDTVIMP
jgi:uncharacterized surface protein with fasciclin (FAS1) repeats